MGENILKRCQLLRPKDQHFFASRLMNFNTCFALRSGRWSAVFNLPHDSVSVQWNQQLGSVMHYALVATEYLTSTPCRTVCSNASNCAGNN